MSSKPLIAPSILSADFTRLGDELAAIKEHGADWVHIDVMDGHFVPNITMGPFIVAACKAATDLPLDVHLMIEHPEGHIEAFAKAGAGSITVHSEASPNLHRTLQSIHDLGCNTGVAINPGTPAEAVRPVLHLADLVLVMTVNPGYSGQAFLPECLSKVRQVRAWQQQEGLTGHIEVDGGINADTIWAAREAGADVFVAASAIFNHPDGIPAGIEALTAELARTNAPTLKA